MWAVPRIIAAILIFSAEGVHRSVLPDHLDIWWGYGAFFIAVAALQGLIGGSLLFSHPGWLTCVAGIGLNVVVAVIWLVTRLGGVPGVATFTPLPLLDLGLAATVLEVLAVGVLSPMALSGPKSKPSGQD